MLYPGNLKSYPEGENYNNNIIILFLQTVQTDKLCILTNCVNWQTMQTDELTIWQTVCVLTVQKLTNWETDKLYVQTDILCKLTKYVNWQNGYYANL